MQHGLRNAFGKTFIQFVYIVLHHESWLDSRTFGIHRKRCSNWIEGQYKGSNQYIFTKQICYSCPFLSFFFVLNALFG